MKVKQINLNHSKLALDSIIHDMKQDRYDTIYMLQEPYYYKNKVPNLPIGYKVYGTQASRSIIIAPGHYPMFFCNDISSKDHTVCLFQNDSETAYFVCVYADIHIEIDKNYPFLKILDFISDNQKNAIICMDSNAHSTLTGSVVENKRGRDLDFLLFHHSIKVLNKGNKPTFYSSMGQTVIDISLQMGNDINAHSWKISDKHYFSDHVLIVFEIDFKKIEPPLIKRVNWGKFKDALNLHIEEKEHEIWGQNLIEEEANFLVASITKALNSSTYISPINVKSSSAHYWNDDLALMQRDVRSRFKKWKDDSSESNRNDYVSLHRSFRMAVRKAKRKCWKEFLGSIADPKSMSLLNKILNRQAQHNIGLIKKPSGELCASHEESIEFLMRSHFPGSVPLREENNQAPENRNSVFRGEVSLPGVQNCAKQFRIPGSTPSQMAAAKRGSGLPGKYCDKKRLDQSFITLENVKLAINSFGDNKIGGPDGFRPLVLKHLSETAFKRLTRLYQAIIELQYTPLIFLESRVVFLPKPNKPDYENYRSWRAINLLNFLAKGLEKLVLWEIETTTLQQNPLSINQFAFRKMYSCDLALSDLVDEIEHSILNQEYALGCFLDIESAFNNARHDDIISAMTEKQISPKIVGWYKHFLTQQVSRTNINGIKKSVKLTRSVPQGAIMSPLCWALVMDSLIKELNDGPIKIRCFADDVCILAKGVDPSTISSIMQEALNKAIAWGAKHSLRFVPEKTVAVFFHRKKRFKPPKRLKMGNTLLDYSDTVKHLGVHLDKGLTMQYHVQQKIIKAKGLIMKVRDAIGSIWGPTPKALKWFYNGVVLPSFSYGAVIWARAAQKTATRAKLKKLNRIMATTMMPCRRSTPTAGLEIVLGLPPLDLKVEEIALKAMLRILPHNRTKWDGLGASSSGHLRWGMDKLIDLGIRNFTFDTTNVLNIHKNYKIDTESFGSGLPKTESKVVCYTDGSKMSSNAGYGFGIMKDDFLLSSENGQLDLNNSVFQAEVTAIAQACNSLCEIVTPRVTIFSDSQAAISSLNSLKVKSKTVLNCIKQLNLLGNHCQVDIKWVKAHADHPGNEFADKEAKLGTTNVNNRIKVLPPDSWAKNLIRSSVMKAWKLRWFLDKECRQTKIWFPKPNITKSQFSINQSRIKLGLFVEMITGHNRLNRHESLATKGLVDPLCRFCLEDDETSWHVIGECPALWLKRRDSFNTFFLENPPEWNYFNLLKFLKLSDLEEVNKRGAADTP